MKIYCYSCGCPSEYTIEKPKFCQKCGAGLSSASKKMIPKKKEAQIEPEPEPEEELKVPNLAGLDVDISHTEAKVMTFGSLIETASPDAKIDNFKAKKPKRVNKKKFWNDFEKEAGRLRDS